MLPLALALADASAVFPAFRIHTPMRYDAEGVAGVQMKVLSLVHSRMGVQVPSE
jgi:hypothetical protein